MGTVVGAGQPSDRDLKSCWEEGEGSGGMTVGGSQAEATDGTMLYSRRRLGAPCVVTLESLAEVRMCIEMKLAGLRRACSQQVFSCQECWLAS